MLAFATGLLLLGCMCGGPGDATLAPSAPVAVGGPAAEPAIPVPPPPAAPEPSGWPASIEGICRMEADCGCLEKESVAACAASLEKSASVFTSDVTACIVGQSCAEMCGGGGVRCVNDGAARQMAAERARHEAVMGVMNNYPSGGPCPTGQTQVVDSRGGFVRCQ